ncbi:uncharacterized protein F5891DRAFT_982736 [Suillus fuscotomentosus]|uniref:Uncharacterized protein n=1 Tax=Suillus fuscotomentosus TaxID=1912939 RepID=A0AAD4E0L2_9AGAM|nr:uncharacterized protein F5891DRAFT_982736 [Suillus fuscotomentosus]KAG1897350.1 hypothetical protein F5891DRAFT_982736 [Suillus fuscotomentosus]
MQSVRALSVMANATIVTINDAAAVAGRRDSWYDPFKTWSETYTFDLLVKLTEAQHKLVLGASSTGAVLDITEALPQLHVQDDTAQHQCHPTPAAALLFTENLTYVEKYMPLLCEKSCSEMDLDAMFEGMH